MPKKVVAALVGSLLALTLAQDIFAYGEEGHSIVAEIAQRRLDPSAQAAVASLLGASMSSVASWADDVRSAPPDKGGRPETANWHFVDIPLWEDSYNRSRDCPATGKGDCAVEELARIRTQLACASSQEERREALKFAIHFVGDIHQPLHTVKEKLGANLQAVSGVVHGAACGKQGCEFDSKKDPQINLHFLWDTGLIRSAYYDWGAYAEALEAGPLKDPHVQQLGQVVDPQTWANETHAVAQVIWPVKNPDGPGNDVFAIDDSYYRQALSLLDKQLAVAGLRLASFLNASFSGAPCDVAPQANLGDLKIELQKYFTEVVESGHTRYELAQAYVVDEAERYLLARVEGHSVARPALVLDIDETSLNNLAQILANDYGYIEHGPCTLETGYACGSDEWDKKMHATAIAPTLKLFKAAREHGVAVFFITGRRESESEHADTARNLEKVGFVGYQGLYLRPQGSNGGVSVTEFKSRTRAKIEADGYGIVVNLGDQPSDLAGGHAEGAYQMPNPAYRIP